MLRSYNLYNQPLSDLPNHKLLITTINAHSYNVAREDAVFARALQQSDVLIPDGVSVVWASRLLMKQKLRKIAGEDLFYYEMKRLQKTGGKAFFLGSSDKVLSQIRTRAAQEFPNIQIHTYSPPYKPAFSDEENQAMIAAVNSVKPDVLFVGMTAPKQEKWAYQQFMEMEVGHVCCIGAVFDFYAGTYKRAPQWFIKSGLEWFYRFIREPKRMWKRYMVGNLSFIFAIMNRNTQNLNYELTLSKLSSLERILLLTSHVKPDALISHKLRVELSLLKQWNQLLVNLKEHESCGLFYSHIKQMGQAVKMPVYIHDELQRRYEANVEKGDRLYGVFKELATLFDRESLEFLVLRGILLAEWLYGDAGLRPLKEIDILIHEKDAEKCLGLMHEAGFQMTESGVRPDTLIQQCHFPYQQKDNVLLKIYVRLNDRKFRYNPDITQIFKNALTHNFAGSQVKAPDIYDLIIHLCVHFDKLITQGQMQMRAFNDIVNILTKFQYDINWNELVGRCHNNYIEKTVLKYVVMAHEFCNAPVPEHICKKYIMFMTLNDEQLFYQGLRCEPLKVSHTATHVQNLKHLNSLPEKLRYFWKLIFSPKSFMVKKYRIPVPFLFFLWYPYRWWTGLLGVMGFYKTNQ